MLSHEYLHQSMNCAPMHEGHRLEAPVTQAELLPVQPWAFTIFEGFAMLAKEHIFSLLGSDREITMALDEHFRFPDRRSHRRAKLVLVVLAGFAVLGSVAAILNPHTQLAIISSTLGIGIATALVVACVAAGDAGDRAGQSVRAREENRHAAVLRERLRIARDLHDTLAHSMAGMLTQIRLIRKIAKADPERLAEELERAEEVALDGLREARSAVTRMRHQAVRDDGLGAALGRLTKQSRLRHGIQIELNVDPRAFALADERTETVFRVVEEAVHNIERHAGVQRGFIAARIKSDASNGCLEVIVRDEGKGFDPTIAAIGHYGITGMREQLETIGGTLLIESTEQRGTQLTINLHL
jgi:signal transduction histidine kinase